MTDSLKSPVKSPVARLLAPGICGGEGCLPHLFAIWLLLAVLTPEEVYRTFFHVLIYPLTICLLARMGKSIVWKDPFVRLFLLFCGYMAVATWLVGGEAAEKDAQAVRWAFEAALGMVAFFMWMFSVARRGRFWGLWFLSLAFIGAFAGLVFSFPEAIHGARIGGLGVMGHPIQGASIATIFLATGLFLTFRERGTVNPSVILLAIMAAVSVCTFVSLSQSRAPLIALMVYLLFLAVLLSCQYRRPVTIFLLFLAATGVVVSIQWFIGLDRLLDQLSSRGMSYRFEIWVAYLSYLPESLLLGNGAGLDFRLTDAARLHLEPLGLNIAHPHNIWLGAFVQTGLIGVLMQAGLVVLPVFAVVSSPMPLTGKFHLLAILGLFLLLTFSDEYTLLISLHPVWFLGWIPLVFVWTWSRYKTEERVGAIYSRDPGGN